MLKLKKITLISLFLSFFVDNLNAASFDYLNLKNKLISFGIPISIAYLCYKIVTVGEKFQKYENIPLIEIQKKEKSEREIPTNRTIKVPVDCIQKDKAWFSDGVSNFRIWVNKCCEHLQSAKKGYKNVRDRKGKIHDIVLSPLLSPIDRNNYIKVNKIGPNGEPVCWQDSEKNQDEYWDKIRKEKLKDDTDKLAFSDATDILV